MDDILGCAEEDTKNRKEYAKKGYVLSIVVSIIGVYGVKSGIFFIQRSRSIALLLLQLGK